MAFQIKNKWKLQSNWKNLNSGGKSMSTDTIPIRKGEELDLQRIETFLKHNLPELADEPLLIRQFSAGRSNLTYELKIGDWEAVLRRPPLGPVAPKAHDMAREYKILKDIHPYFPAAPKPFVFADESIIGTPFIVMERKRGVVLDTKFPEGVEVSVELCQNISGIMVKSLVDLHDIDYQQTGLKDITRPEGFMERQVHGWISRYDRAKTDEIKNVDYLKEWLVVNLPPSQNPTVIHYDYKLNNSMFNYELTKMIGLFDWEMTTVGDPLADLGAAMSYWIQPDDSDLLKRGLGNTPITAYPGFISRDQFIQSYAVQSGRDVSNMNFYLTFAYFKLAVICQQIYYRWKKGQTKDERFSELNIFVNNLVQYALFTASKGY
jgi:aminoglycoside phosphotransferase (APT) family kinase protein